MPGRNASGAVDLPVVGEAAVRQALEGLLKSRQFAQSPRACRFLRYVVEEALAGHDSNLREYVLGMDVFDRGASFDPRTDTIVRVVAMNIRARLRAYYRGAGRQSPVVIELPRGGYRPRFRLRTTPKPVETGSAPTAAEDSRTVSVAVLPFAAVSSDADGECWSDGLTDELMSTLARAGAMSVVSRTSAFAFKGARMDLREIGRLLGADVVVEGSVRKTGSRVRVTVHLIAVATGLHLWSSTMDRTLEDVWMVQQELAEAITLALEVKLTPEQGRRASKRLTANPEAFERYLEARFLFERHDFDSKRQAMALFEEALRLDSGYALPWLGLGRCHLYWAMVGLEPPRVPVSQARAALERAISLDPDLGEARGLLALVHCRHERNWSEGDHQFLTALQLAPHSAEIRAWRAAEFLAPLGRFEEAVAENRRARQLDPFSLQVALGGPYILALSRRFREAEEEYRRIFAAHPDHPGIRGGVAFTLWGQGRLAEALEEFRIIDAHDPGSGRGKVLLATMEALCGNTRPATEVLDELHRQSASSFVPAISRMYLHMALRDLDQAMLELERAAENQEDALLYAKVAFVFDPLRGHPRFAAILRNLHLA